MTSLKYHVNLIDLVSSNDDLDWWSCEKCVDNKRIYGRNCKHPIYGAYTETEIEEIAKKSQNKYAMDFGRKKDKKKQEKAERFGGKFSLPDGSRISECPMSHYREDYYRLVALIYWSEDMKILPFEPQALMEQTNFYVEARYAVIGQRSKIDQLRRKQEEEKNKKTRTRQ